MNNIDDKEDEKISQSFKTAFDSVEMDTLTIEKISRESASILKAKKQFKLNFFFSSTGILFSLLLMGFFTIYFYQSRSTELLDLASAQVISNHLKKEKQ